MQSIASHQLEIYNSLSGKKESFTPISKEYVGMYVCGPTVYSKVHLGNLRTWSKKKRKSRESFSFAVLLLVWRPVLFYSTEE